MRSGNIQEKIAYWIFQDKIPVTKLVIISNVLTFLAIALFQVRVISYYLGFSPYTLLVMPWTLFTYPLVGVCCSFINLLFSCLWLWFAGGSLERSWGSRGFGIFFFLISAVSAMGIFVGTLISGEGAGLQGLWMPLAAVTIAFAMLNPEQQIMFYFFIPLKLKYLALIDVVLVLVQYGRINLILGVFALTGCAVSYWYVRYGREYGRGSRRFDDRDKVVRLYRRPSLIQRLNPSRWIKDRREKKKLKDFFDKSGFGE